MNVVKKGTGIQSLELGLSIIEFVSSYGKPPTFTEIQEGTKITKSNLYKYLHSLTSLGLLYRDKFDGSYSLGSKLIEYGMSAINQENVIEKVAPYLQEIRMVCKETLIFSVWTNGGPMIVRLINSNQILNIGANIGSYLPLQSATGEIFAAFMEDYQTIDWINKELAHVSEEERQRIVEVLKQIKEKGISFMGGALIPSISAVAVPVLNYRSELLGVISLVGFADTISGREEDEKNQYLLKMSQKISEEFGYKQTSN